MSLLLQVCNFIFPSAGLFFLLAYLKVTVYYLAPVILKFMRFIDGEKWVINV